MVSVVITLLFISGDTSYKIPQVDISIKGTYLWPLLTLAQLSVAIKGHLTAAITGVQFPWNIPRVGPWGNKSVWRLPEYWVVFFNQSVPMTAYVFGLTLSSIQLIRIFILA